MKKPYNIYNLNKITFYFSQFILVYISIISLFNFFFIVNIWIKTQFHQQEEDLQALNKINNNARKQLINRRKNLVSKKQRKASISVQMIVITKIIIQTKKFLIVIITRSLESQEEEAMGQYTKRKDYINSRIYIIFLI